MNAVSTVPVPASNNLTLNCRYRHFKQKLNDAGTGTRVIVPAEVTYKGLFVASTNQQVPVVQRFSTVARNTIIQGSILAVCMFFYFFFTFLAQN